MKKCEICGKECETETFFVFKNHSLCAEFKAEIQVCQNCKRDICTKFGRTCIREETQKRIMKEQNWTIQNFVQVFGRNFM